MNFDLKTPCNQCPFRRDCPPRWLGHKRAAQIAGSLDEGKTFTCHKTGRAPGRSDEQHCAGALIVLKKAQGGFSGNISLAIALGLFDYRALDLDAPVFNTFEEFIRHHERDTVRIADLFLPQQEEA